MYFNSKKVAFSRHESFVLRFGWLTKGFRAFDENQNIFTQKDAVVTLGVGKNMVNSIRHWLRAAKLIVWESDIKEVTPLGKAIFSDVGGWDPFLEDEATIWLIHWLIATNPEHATAWYWFFNHFHKPEFTSEEVSSALSDFINEKIESPIALSSIKQDTAVLLRSYVQSKNSNKAAYEDVLDSPLSLLRLITHIPSTKSYRSKLESREKLPIGIFGYAICDYLKTLNASRIPIEDLIYCKEGSIAPGLVFRLTENSLLAKLEQLIYFFPGLFAINQTAGIHQFFVLNGLDNLDPFDMLMYHYKSKIKNEAA